MKSLLIAVLLVVTGCYYPQNLDNPAINGQGCLLDHGTRHIDGVWVCDSEYPTVTPTPTTTIGYPTVQP